MTKQSHYDTLGIDPRATADEVKAAYRRKASETHPDKGGSESAFKAAGAAYEALRDPARRARYDQHGDEGDGSPTDPRAMAEDVLEDLFENALADGGNVVAHVMTKLQANASTLLRRRGQALEKRGRLLLRRPTVTTKAGTPNVFAKVVNKKVAALDAEIVGIDGATVINDLMLRMMGDYSDSEPAVQTRRSPAADGIDALLAGAVFSQFRDQYRGRRG